MNDPTLGPHGSTDDDVEASVVAFALVVARRVRLVVYLASIGAAVGLTIGLLSPRRYVSATTFVPQQSEAATSGLGLAASTFGVQLPNSDADWSPSIYVELLRSRGILESIVRDSIRVTEEGGRRVAVLDLLEVGGSNPDRRVAQGIAEIQKVARVDEDKRLGTVNIVVTTRWSSVSLALVERLLAEVNAFNVETRRSRASAERQFLESRISDATGGLRAAEDAMQAFLQRNRSIGSSPELTFQQDRLQRAIALQQATYTTLAQRLEEARAREVRDTPVITVLVPPELALVPESRRSPLKGILGGALGTVLALVIAFVFDRRSRERHFGSAEWKELFMTLREALPRPSRR